MTAANGRSDRHVRVQEVGARDGLQNEPRTVPAEIKVDLIERLADRPGCPPSKPGPSFRRNGCRKWRIRRRSSGGSNGARA